MAAVLFDTLAYSKKLRLAGFTEQQAEIQAEAIVELVDNKLATKDDIRELALATKDDIRELALATKNDIYKLENDIKELAATTKRDIHELAVTTKRDIHELAVTTKRDMDELAYKLTIKTGIMLAGAVTLLGMLIKL